MSTTVDDLDSASLMDERLLGEAQQSAQSDGNGEFTVTSDQDVSKAFRAIKAAEEKIESLEAEREREHDKIDEFYDPKVRNAEQTIEFLKAKIDGYIDSTEESVSTPHGKAYEVNRTKWEWADRDTLVQFAKAEYPDLVETSEKVSKNDLKSAIKDEWDAAHEDDPPVVKRKNQTSSRIYTT